MVRMKKDERILLNDLNELLNITERFIKSNGQDGLTYFTLRPHVMWNNLILMHHNALSVSILLQDKQIYSSSALVRVLIEQWVNMNYIYLTKSYKSLVRFLYHGDVEFIQTNKRYETFIKENPDYRRAFKDEDFTEVGKYREDAIRELKKYKYELKKMPDLRTRADLVDTKNGNRNLTALYMGRYLINSISIHSSKDTLFAMTHAKNYSELLTGYDLIADNFSQEAFMASHLIANALLFVEGKSKLSLPRESRELISVYGT